MPESAPLKGWYRRGERHPPHFDGGDIQQFITFRLTGTLPQEKLSLWKQQLKLKQITDQDLHDRVEAYLDAGAGECWLEEPRVAELVQNALLHFDGDRYALHGWVLMPNHVHVLITPAGNQTLPAILHTWKSYTSRLANKILRRTGIFWDDDYFDRYIRNLEHFEHVLWYIANNPVKARLTSTPGDWRWSHASKTTGGWAPPPPF